MASAAQDGDSSVKRCKHENAEHLVRGAHLRSVGDHRDVLIQADCEQFRCLDCGAWLSLGPSNDSPRAVQREIALADRLADLHRLWEPGAEFEARMEVAATRPR